MQETIPQEVTPLVRKQDGNPSYQLKLARLFGCVSSVSEGYDIGCFGAVASTIQSEFSLRPEQMSVMVGVPMLFQATGTWLGGSLADVIGRKATLCCTASLLIIGTVVQAFATNHLVFLAGRCIVMMAGGAGLTGVSLYMSEVSPSAIRGRYCALEEVLLMVGVSLSYVAAWLFVDAPSGWRVVVGAGIGAPVLGLCLLFCFDIPESPRFLLKCGRRSDAEEVLKQLLGDQQEIEVTLESWGKSRETQKDPVPVRAACICFGTLIGISITGAIVLSHSLTYILKFVLDRESTAVWALVMNITKFLMLLPVCFYWLDSFGRRPLLIMSSVCMGLGAAIAAMGVSVLSQTHVWLFPFGMCVQLTSYSLGLGPAQWTYCSEIIPTEHRAEVFGFALCVARLMNAIQLFALPLVLEIGVWIPFAFYAATGLAFGACVWWFCPETKNKRLEDISC